MIKIQFIEPSSEEWSEWKIRCQKATEKIIEHRSSGIPTDFNIFLYKEMKKEYFSAEGPFHGKCAYCESFIAADQPGDIEHFRPKAEVRDIHNQVVKVLDNRGNECKHPGYYWLAYDWRNLLPCCKDCNTRTSNWKTNYKPVGKGNRFPIEGSYAVRPGEEVDEQPMLINPTEEDPSNHIKFTENGVAFKITERGEKCIEIFGLNDRVALATKRAEAYREANNTLLSLISHYCDVYRDCSLFIASGHGSLESYHIQPHVEKLIKEGEEKIKKIVSGREAYSAVGRSCIDSKLPLYEALGTMIFGKSRILSIVNSTRGQNEIVEPTFNEEPNVPSEN